MPQEHGKGIVWTSHYINSSYWGVNVKLSRNITISDNFDTLVVLYLSK